MMFKTFSNVFLCFCGISLCVEMCLAYSPTWGPTFVTCDEKKEEDCIEIRQCPIFADLLNKSSDPPPLSERKFVRVYLCALHDHIPYVCCQKPPSPPTVEVRIAPPADFNKLTKSINKHMNFNLLPTNICGSIATNPRITGTQSAARELPWMALLVYDTNQGPVVSCGGTVINERYVLTAAHCVNSKLGGVRLGEHNLNTTEDCDSKRHNCAPATQDFYIEDIIKHTEYNSRTRENNIALVRLATPANFSYSNVQPICLPMGEMDLNEKFALVAGFGLTQKGYNSLELSKATLPVLPNLICQGKYKRFLNVTSKQICAGGYETKNSCVADSGGPMMYVELIDGVPKFVQYGILSYSPRFCLHPGVYTRVAKYVEWILDNLTP